MTPKEKANKLVDEFYQTTPNEAWYCPPLGSLSMEYKAWEQAKQCALIMVDEILKNFERLHKPEYCAFDAIGERKFIFQGEYDEYMTGYDMIEYWQEVKDEIGKL